MEKDLELLNKIYEASYIESGILNYMLPSVQNASIRKEIIREINEYDKINTDIKSEICNLGKKPSKPILREVSSKIGTKINLSLNSNVSNIAKMIIKETNENILELTQIMNKSQLSTPKCYDLGRRLLKEERKNVESISQFL